MKYLYPKKIYSNLDKNSVKSLYVNTGLQIDINEDNTVTLNPGDYLILDYGKETNGSVRILTNASFNKASIRIRYGESLMEASSFVGFKGSTNDHSTRDFIAYIPNHSDLTFNESGFRYVRIDPVEDTIIKIKSVVVKENIYEKKFVGKFKTDNKLLNKIFNTAAYTVRLCLQNDVIWDGIKRDRLVWIGDMHPEVTSLLYLFGDIKNIKNALNHAKKYNPLPCWMNNIPSYSLWWIIINHDYYLFSGDKEYLKEQLEYLKGLLKQLDDSISVDGTISFKNSNGEMEFFLDWPTTALKEDDLDKRNDSYLGVHALFVLALKYSKEIFNTFNIDSSTIDKMSNKLLKEKKEVINSKEASALRIIAGINTKNDEKVLLKDSSKGISTFMAGYIFKGLSIINKTDLALTYLLEYYGAMLNKGATTFFEDFNLDWVYNSNRIDKTVKKNEKDIHGDFGDFCYKGYRHSLCHGWSSSIIGFLYQDILGIKIKDPRCKTIDIKPKLCSIKKIDAAIPTPYGKIVINISDGKIDVQAPKEITIV